MWVIGGGYVGTGGTTLSSLRYSLAEQPRLTTREYHNDVWSSADGEHWRCHTEAAPWAARSYLDVAAFDGCLWVIGGHRGIADSPAEIGTDGNRNDVWYSRDGEQWTELPATPWNVRHACGVHVHCGSLMLAGGSAVTVMAEEVAKTLADHTYRTQCEWRPADVWKLEKAPAAAVARL